jgi:formylglycine-generating enzyme required for sulfatase activity
VRTCLTSRAARTASGTRPTDHGVGARVARSRWARYAVRRKHQRMQWRDGFWMDRYTVTNAQFRRFARRPTMDRRRTTTLRMDYPDARPELLGRRRCVRILDVALIWPIPTTGGSASRRPMAATAPDRAFLANWAIPVVRWPGKCRSLRTLGRQGLAD